MIEGGNPVVNSIGPIVAGGRDLAVGVLGENQTIFWVPVIVNGDLQFVSSIRRPRQNYVEHLRRALEFSCRS